MGVIPPHGAGVVAQKSKIFDLYKEAIGLVKFDVEHSRLRFYETAKLHVAITGGALALAAFGATQELLALSLACLVSVFWSGIVRDLAKADLCR